MVSRIAYQGEVGAYSEIACHAAAPAYEPLSCASFDDAFAATRDHLADLAMIPVENSVVGRVADVHRLLPDGGLFIVGEHYQPVTHHLLTVKDVTLDGVKNVYSHPQALAQCRKWIRARGMTPIAFSDTASAAKFVAEKNDPSLAAIASELAGAHFGLQSLARDIADAANNTTRFLIMARETQIPDLKTTSITTLLFRVKSVPSALYKALGGFATNGINITKLESYLVDGHFNAAQFYLDAEGHIDEPRFQNALAELRHFAQSVTVLGTYPAHKFRSEN